MSKIKISLINSGKQIAYLSQEANRIWMTEEQIHDAGLQIPNRLLGLMGYSVIDTNIGELCVYRSIAIRGEPVSYESIGHLLGEALKYYEEDSAVYYTDEPSKCRIARIIFLIYTIKRIPTTSIIAIIARELGCSQSEATRLLKLDRSYDTKSGSVSKSQSVDFLGEWISYNSLCDLLEYAYYFMHKAYEDPSKLGVHKCHLLEERIARCRYLCYRLSGDSRKTSISQVAEEQGISKQKCRHLLIHDRNRIG